MLPLSVARVALAVKQLQPLGDAAPEMDFEGHADLDIQVRFVHLDFVFLETTETKSCVAEFVAESYGELTMKTDQLAVSVKVSFVLLPFRGKDPTEEQLPELLNT